MKKGKDIRKALAMITAIMAMTLTSCQSGSAGTTSLFSSSAQHSSHSSSASSSAEGLSALYEQMVHQGYEGTYEQWLSEIFGKGDQETYVDEDDQWVIEGEKTNTRATDDEIAEYKHVHSYSDEWSSDETWHWHDATCGHDVTKDREEHHFEDVYEPPTYEQNGHRGRVCTTCGYFVKLEEIGHLQHNYSPVWEHDEHTHWHPCIDDGYSHLKGDEQEHQFDSQVHAPTYGAGGYTTYTCSICGYNYIDEETAPLEHQYTTNYVYDENGHWHACVDSGYEFLKKDYSAHHLTKHILAEPSYEGDGYYVYYCDECDYATSPIAIPMLSHHYAEDYSYDISMHWKACTDPGYEDLRTDSDMHNIVQEYVAPTFDQPGYNRSICSVCGYINTSSEIPPLQHQYDSNYTFDEEMHWRACLDQGYEDLYSDKAQHSFVNEVVAPTYDRQGYTIRTCTICGYQRIGDYTDQLIHQYSAQWSQDSHRHWHDCIDEGFDSLRSDLAEHNYYQTTLAPTFESGGYTEHTCLVCGYSYRDNYTNPLQHSYSAEWQHDEVNHWHDCLDAGYEDLRGSEAPHNYGDWKIDTPATTFGDGLQHRICQECGHRQEKILNATGTAEKLSFTLHQSSTDGYYSVRASSDDIDGDLVIPAFYEGLPVKAVETDGFKGTKIASLTLGANVLTLCRNAFTSCTNLETIHWNAQDGCYGQGEVFSGCTSLRSIIVAEGICSIGANAFNGITSVSLSLPSTINQIAEHAFEKAQACDVYYSGSLDMWSGVTLEAETSSPFIRGGKLFLASASGSITFDDASYEPVTELCFGQSASSIGNYQFYGLSGISAVTLSPSIKSIGIEPFAGTEISRVFYPGTLKQYLSLSYEDSSSNPMGIADQFYLSEDGEYALLETLSIPEPIAIIKPYQFYGFDCLREVDLGDHILSVGVSAFAQCSGLTQITIPEQLKTLDTGAFESCKSLETVTYKATKAAKAARPFLRCSSLTNIIIANNVLTIPDEAFRHCSHILEITIPESVTSIGALAFGSCSSLETVNFNAESCYFAGGEPAKAIFDECTSLTQINVGPNTKNIPSYAFYGCKNLRTVILSDAVKTIGNAAFFNCASLETLSIGNNIEHIGENAFYHCGAMKNVFCRGDLASWCGIIFDNRYANPLNENGNINFLDPAGEISFQEKNYVRPTALSLPESIVSFGDYQFVGFRQIESIYLPLSISSFGKFCFEGDSIEKVYYGGSLPTWNEISFQDAASNPAHSGADVFFHDEAGDYRFEGKRFSLLQKLTTTTQMSHIAPFAFAGFTSLKEIEISANILSIGQYAFANCAYIETIVVPETVLSLGIGCFSGMSRLREITLPFIGSDHASDRTLCFVFGGNNYQSSNLVPSSLKTVTLSNACDHLPDRAFYGCQDIATINLSASITEVSKYCFERCSSLSNIVIPQSITSFLDGAFTGCDVLHSVHYLGSIENWLDISFAQYDAHPCSNLADLYIQGEKLTSLSLSGKPLKGLSFYGCRCLSRIEITDSETIPYWCFGRCVNLSSVTLTNIERIGAGAFINCESLTNIVLDNKLRLSDEQVFKGCNSIRKIYYRGSIDNWCGIEFVGLASTPFHKTALLYLEDAEGDTLFDDVHYTLTQSLILPDTLTNIGAYQFYGIKSITSVIIPANVALISDFAFGQMVDLTTVDFNAINTSLSSNSSPFSGCEGLSRIVFGDEVEQVPSYLFQNCGGVQEITFGTKVNTIGDGAFYGCAKLEQLILNDSLTTVGKDAFGGCSNMSKISFGPSLCAIGASAFYTASVAERSVYYRGDFDSWCSIVFTNMYSIPFGRGGFLYLIAENGEETFDGAQYAQLTSIEIPQQTTQVGDYQFAKIYGVMTVTIGAHVTSVGEYAFAQCKDMTALIIDSELSKLGEGAFYGNVSLESINTKTIGNPATDGDRISYLFGGTPPQTLTHYEIGAGVIDKLTFQDCNIISLTIYGTAVIGDGSFTYAKIQELSIGESVTSIGDQAFMNCAQLTSVTLGQSLTNIGVSAFANCISLTSVTTPYSLKVLGDYTFEGCSNITEVVLRGDDLSIGAFAFSYNSKLDKVTLGSGVRSLARQVFWYANNITEVYFEGDLSAWANLYFEDEHAQPCHFGAKLYFNGQRVADIVIPESVTKLNDWAFYGVQGLRNLHFGPTLKEFGYTTFRDIVFENIYYSDSYATYGQLFEGTFPQGHYLYCNDSLITEVTITSNRFSFSYNLGIVHVDINTNLTMLADQFLGCANLKTIRLPDTLKSFVATNAFGDCASLESIVIPESCTQLGNGLFKGCVSLASVTLPSSSTYLSEGMFEGCASLKQIELPAALTSISPRAFAQCTALTSIVIPQGVTQIGDSAFYGCSSLASVQLPSSLSAIDSSAFESCAAIVTINLPESLETLGFRAFCNCSSLAAISIPEKVTNLSWTFFNCTALCDVTLNDNISWMDGTFSGCASLESIVLPSKLNMISRAFSGCTSLTSVALPNGLTELGDETFMGCASLTSIVLNEGLQFIGENAFNGCSLVSVRIPSTVVSIKEYALTNTASIYLAKPVQDVQWSSFGSSPDTHLYLTISSFEDFSNWNYSGPATIHLMDENGNEITEVVLPEGLTSSLLHQCPNTLKVTIPTSYDSLAPWMIPPRSDLTLVLLRDNIAIVGTTNAADVYIYIQSWANYFQMQGRQRLTGTIHFMDANGNEITEVLLPEGITTIPAYAFSHSTIKTIQFPSSLKTIGNAAFEYCVSLKEITLPNAVDSLGSYAFQHCTGLTYFDTGNSLQVLPEWCLYDCSSLRTVVIGKKIIDCNVRTFDSCFEIETVIFKNGGYLDIYSLSSYGNLSLAKYVRFEADTNVIYGSACHGFTNLETVIIVEGIVTIGNAFYGCASLSSVQIPTTVVEIARGAFSDCTSLVSITIPGSVTTIGEFVFSGCSALTSITFTGTMAQWNALISWNLGEGQNVKTIHCKDGDLSR